jgi:hypothetical protein
MFYNIISGVFAFVCFGRVAEINQCWTVLVYGVFGCVMYVGVRKFRGCLLFSEFVRLLSFVLFLEAANEDFLVNLPRLLWRARGGPQEVCPSPRVVSGHRLVARARTAQAEPLLVRWMCEFRCVCF